MPVEFNIKFITPLLIGGSGNNSCDPDGLTGKALRGCWRFWFRAVCGGLSSEAGAGKKLLQLEKDIFGDTTKPTFRLRVIPFGIMSSSKKFARCPHRTGGKRAERRGFDAGCCFTVTILPHNGPRNGLEEASKVLSDEALGALKASIWLWGNLGAVGNRARRGFGSPLLCAEEGTFPTELPVSTSVTDGEFVDRDALVDHLKKGTDQAIAAIRTYARITPSSPLPTPPAKFFVLQTMQQIMVAGDCISDLYTKDETADPGAINKIHGSRNNNEIGTFSPRLASPVLVRLHKTNDGFFPVATWSGKPATPFSGTPDTNTALGYIVEKLGCTTDISGSSLCKEQPA